jgi:hypothetical protein
MEEAVEKGAVMVVWEDVKQVDTEAAVVMVEYCREAEFAIN